MVHVTRTQSLFVNFWGERRLGPVTHTHDNKASLPFLPTSSPGFLLHVLFTASNLCFLVLYFSKEKKEKSLTLLLTYISP